VAERHPDLGPDLLPLDVHERVMGAPCTYCGERANRHALLCRLTLRCDACNALAAMGCVCSRCARERSQDASEGFFVCANPDCLGVVNAKHDHIRGTAAVWVKEVSVPERVAAGERLVPRELPAPGITVSGTAAGPGVRIPALGERVDHPQHYGGDTLYEAIKVIEAWELGFNLGNTVKYISRAERKGAPLEDLKKAAWYLAREIAKRERAK
jgi:hypothetical protein